MKKATWYGLTGKNHIQVYIWYRRLFRHLTVDEILEFNVEPETAGEIAQLYALGGISRSDVLLLKTLAKRRKARKTANPNHIAVAKSPTCK